MADLQSGVPDVQQVVDELLSGVPTTPSGGAETPPEQAAAPAGSGFRFEETAPPPAPTPAPAVPQADLQEARLLRDELVRERQRVADNQRNFHGADQQRQLAQATVDALMEVRQREAALYQQAAQYAPPRLDGDALLSDGNQLVNALGQMAQWNEARLMAQLGPYARQIGEMYAQVQAQQNLSRRIARNEAKRMVEEKLGGQDFDQVWPDIETMFRASGAAGEQMMLDPDNIARAYALQRFERGGNPFASNRAPAPPPSADPRPAVTRASNPESRARLAQLAPMARNVARTLGLGDDLPVTDQDLALLGL